MPPMSWLFLLLACVFEITWTVCMKYSDGFTRPWPSAFTLVASVVSFVLLAMAVRTLPLGNCYAVLNGIGIAGAMVFGIVLFGESMHPLRILFVAMILVGVIGLRINVEQKPTERPTSRRCPDTDQSSNGSVAESSVIEVDRRTPNRP
jgi:quaternary ammonium compound-resistance protein SugE